MRFSLVKTILKKELTETLRDRRTLLIMVGLPVLLYPLMMIGFSATQESRAKARQARVSRVAVWGDPPAALLEALGADERLSCTPWSGATGQVRRHLPMIAPPPAPEPGEDDPHADAAPPFVGAAHAAIGREDLDAVLVTWAGFKRDLERQELAQVSIFYDSTDANSRQARKRLKARIERYRRSVRQERERGLPKGFSQVLTVREDNTAPIQKRSGHFLGAVLPFVIIVMSLMGGFYPSIDLTAGEKERNTMQTLLCAPLRPAEIIVGKFLAVWVVAIVAGLANIASLAATLSRVGPATVEITPRALTLTFLLYLPVCFITSACFLAVGVFAKDFKDGQNFVTPVYMVLALPVGITMLPDVVLTPATAFAPIVNVALLIKGLLAGKVQGGLVFLTLASTAAYACLALLVAIRVFERRQILLGGSEPLRETLGLTFRGGEPATPSFVLAFSAVLLVGIFYASLAFKKLGLIGALLATQLGFFLLPALICVAVLAFPARSTLALRPPSLRGLLGAILIGISGWTVVFGFAIRVLPPPEELLRSMQKLQLVDQPLWLVLLLLAVLPPICEEFLFRGLILSGLRSLGQWPAIVISALVFGVFHMSLWRMIPTVFLGVLLGYVVWRTGSIACGIVVHALNNGLAVVLSRHAPQLGPDQPLAWPLTWAGLAVLILGLILVCSLPPAPVEEPPQLETEPA